MSAQSVVRCVIFASVFGVSSLSALQKGHGQDGIGERIGQQLDRGFERLGDEIRENWNSLRQFVDKLGVQGRVYARLRWDKELEQSRLDIEVDEAGVVELAGQVPNELAKQKAVKLANDTIGVVEVVDRLTVVAAKPKS